MNTNKRQVRHVHVFSALGLVAVFVVGWMVTTSILHGEVVYQDTNVSSSTPEVVTTKGAGAASTTTAVDGEAIVIYPAVEGNTEHIQTPSEVRAVYLSQCTAGAPALRAKVVDFITSSNLNAVVLDIKDSSGGIAFPTDDPTLAPYVSHDCGASDMKAFIASLHQKNIYVIGRLTTFQDPLYTKAHPDLAVQSTKGGMWKNNGGISFVDVSAKPFWDYIVHLAQVSYLQIGYDEINFDYIRFPSDGPLSEAVYPYSKDTPKAEAVEAFFKYLHAHVQPDGASVGKDAPPMSADLFGMVSSHTDDLGIGQVLEKAFPYFDYIDPMDYVSHYPKGFDGYQNVNDHVYDIVYSEVKHAVARAKAAGYTSSKIRPWLQSFDYPVTYTPDMVEQQIKAEHDGGAQSYLFWDAGNKYVSLRQALQQ